MLRENYADFMESKLNMAVPSALSVFQVHLVQAPTTQVLIEVSGSKEL